MNKRFVLNNISLFYDMEFMNEVAEINWQSWEHVKYSGIYNKVHELVTVWVCSTFTAMSSRTLLFAAYEEYWSGRLHFHVSDYR